MASFVSASGKSPPQPDLRNLNYSSSPHTMNNNTDYLLLFRGNEWQKRLSPEELEKTLGRFMGWFEELKAEGKMKGANPLYAEGKLVSGSNGRIVVDGPFAESKEAIGGYFLVSVAGEEEAVTIAQ